MKKIFASIVLCGILATAPAVLSGSFGLVAQAQNNVTVSGTVIDENGDPIIGAGIVVKGTTNGTTADLDGNFSLTVPAGSVLEFVSVGFETVEKTVNVGGEMGTITMPTEHTVLDQVVVIGYGSQKKVDLTGSVAIVDADEMKKVSHSNISTMLEGKVAGVQITSDGQPGADPAVRIRGLAASAAPPRCMSSTACRWAPPSVTSPRTTSRPSRSSRMLPRRPSTVPAQRTAS